MTWFKVDDGLAEHPKFERLEDDPVRYMAAVAVWTMMGSDCARKNTGGKVTRARLRKVLNCLGEMAAVGAEALVSVGLWEVDGSEYQFHDWADYQPTKADVEAARKSKTERQRRWRASVDASTAASTRPSRDASTDSPVDAAVDGSVDASGDAAVDGVARVDPGSRSRIPIPERESGTTLTLVGGISARSERLVALVRAGFERRFIAATTSPPSWSKKNVDNCQTVAAWLEKKGGDLTRTLDQVLDGFFAEPWARSKGFPLTLLANDPAKFFRAPERPRDVSTGFCAPAPSNAFVPTSPDSVFGPEPKS